MKNILVSVSMLAYFSFPVSNANSSPFKNSTAQNIFIITTDGFRWQEVFTGADSTILANKKFTQNPDIVKKSFWDSRYSERRKLLMPFFWSTIAKEGQLFGNRLEGNKMNTANPYAISYPGYNEILTGTTDPFIFSNDKKLNPNTNLLEYLDQKEDFHNKVAAFSSWNLFPYILNKARNNLFVNIDSTKKVRSDSASFAEAKSYIDINHPKLLLLSFGETDEYAHSGKYDLYLHQANRVDSMIANLWEWTQQTPGYKDNTLFIITTDHGRGSSSSNWKTHGLFTNGSSQTWMACIGPGITGSGERKEKNQLYNKQLAFAIVNAAGYVFGQ